ncbi:hypothetical protein [Devosia epidermidihirudinis]|nr:hypothetical protein [Devosia epidermidihirudinis]
MNNVHTLTRHRDIQAWVTNRRGGPAIARIRDRFGEERAELKLSFDRNARNTGDMARADDGISPCSWTAWFAELDRQQLALKIDPDVDAFELVQRQPN